MAVQMKDSVVDDTSRLRAASGKELAEVRTVVDEVIG